MYPEKVRALVLQNSTAKADSEERKSNRDRAIKAVKKEYTTFVRMSITNLFNEENREKMIAEIEKVKIQALKTLLQGIVASLEGMKIRKDRETLLRSAAFPMLLILGKKDGVLNYEDNLKQIENTNVELITFPDGHMSHIENKDELKNVLLEILKGI